MDYEILGTEDDERATAEPPRRPVGTLVGAVAALGALVAAMLLFGSPGDWAGQAGPTPTPTGQRDEYRAWAISDSAMVTPPADPPRAELSMGPGCDPLVMPRDRMLRVQFELVNSGATRLRLQNVRPYLPMPGYLKLIRATAGGVCTAPGSEPVARSLAPGERVLVSWDFALRQACPKPAPVLVSVRARMITGVRTLQFPLFSDLGSIPFTDC